MVQFVGYLGVNIGSKSCVGYLGVNIGSKSCVDDKISAWSSGNRSHSHTATFVFYRPLESSLKT